MNNSILSACKAVGALIHSGWKKVVAWMTSLTAFFVLRPSRWIFDRVTKTLNWLALRKEQILGGTTNTVINVIGNILPFLITVLFYAVTTTAQPDGVHYKDGQFFLFASSLLTSAAYIFYDFKTRVYDFYSIFFFISFSLLLIVACIYCWQLAGKTIDEATTLKVSIPIFGVSVLLFYIANLRNQVNVDVKQRDNQQIQKIEEAMPND